ncbi:MAG: methyltransferase domain-containing protein [Acidiferrobacterales bacterium]|nr:methyltransferase domain-containing protein [Acidiferrobacterales bacterium]
MAYDEKFVRGLEWMWGDGFLSPGGREEVREILRGTSIEGQTVLDIGCGIGGIDRLLVTEHKARKVVAIDVIETLVTRARLDTEAAGLTGRIEYRLVEPGQLDFDDAEFDVVFTKDAIVHIKDKRSIYEDIRRVLRPGGVVVGSDWLGGDKTEQSERVRAWLDFSKLDFHFHTAAQLKRLLMQVGFSSVRTRDRNGWYGDAVRVEIASVSGERRSGFVEKFGEEMAANRLQSSTLKMKAVDAGELRPTHFSAVRT